MTVENTLAHGLKTSVFGSQWNVEHGENLALLDPDRIKSDTLANRPVAGVAHRFFFATDNQRLYYDTGAAWADITAAALAHAASHASGGSDPLALAQSQVTNLAADLAGKEPVNANIQAHIASAANPHATTAAQIALGNVENKTFAVGVADAVHAATGKATPVDADELPIVDSAATNILKKLTWANLKATLKTYLDTIYVALTGNQSIGGVKTFTDMMKFSRGVQVASAAALNIPSEDGLYFNVTGTTGITSISTRGATGTGAAKGILPLVILKFDDTLTITHNAASLILPSGIAIKTYAGLVLTFVEESAGNWRCIGRTDKQSSFMAYLTADETLTDSTFAVGGITAGWTEVYDTNGDFDNASGAGHARHTPTIPGRYLYILNVRFSSNTPEQYSSVYFRKNGVLARAHASTDKPLSTSANTFSVAFSAIMQANGTTDYFDFTVATYSTGAGSRLLKGGAEYLTSFSGVRLGD